MPIIRVAVDDQLIPDVHKRLDGHTVSQLESRKRYKDFTALEEDFLIFPIDINTYRVISVKDSGENSEYTVSVFDKPICECGNYVYNCIGSDKQDWCKHIFRVWSEVRVGELPPLGSDPREWLRDKIQREILIQMDDNIDNAKTLRTANEVLKKERLEDKDYRYVINIWRKYRTETPPNLYEQ